MPVYNKLVRDRIPEIIEKSGKRLSLRILGDEEYMEELRTKLGEELEEYLAADHAVAAVEELADMLELIYAAAAAHGATPHQLDMIREKKAEERGAFNERIYLIEVEDE
ncbi:phosphoribosyl-ATP pyrophosphohydrolase [Bacillus sp. OxB-1]|uniref:nucleoside triphosphate pyrophosphohydrolase n=1 Tax=Bacillus sp. (strain OxB-1) TaxID=98228 RepID=UPI000581E084|nr:nucleoside triphosphate pyrophosphohydrolase [Bacillus sp. OxB-1]BAQ09388.1 phosphoribosyl-ATP pyrophosphohydrolase [Bacillus sp. OxB-1]